MGDAEGRSYAFTKGNAGARFADFFHDADMLQELNWDAISATDWRNPDVEEGKQAEFLVKTSFPWRLIETIGVINDQMAE
jgi:hypothetical protein